MAKSRDQIEQEAIRDADAEVKGQRPVRRPLPEEIDAVWQDKFGPLPGGKAKAESEPSVPDNVDLGKFTPPWPIAEPVTRDDPSNPPIPSVGFSSAFDRGPKYERESRERQVNQPPASGDGKPRMSNTEASKGAPDPAYPSSTAGKPTEPLQRPVTTSDAKVDQPATSKQNAATEQPSPLNGKAETRQPEATQDTSKPMGGKADGADAKPSQPTVTEITNDPRQADTDGLRFTNPDRNQPEVGLVETRHLPEPQGVAKPADAASSPDGPDRRASVSDSEQASHIERIAESAKQQEEYLKEILDLLRIYAQESGLGTGT